MGYIIALTIIIVGILAYLWVGGIDYMQKHHPDYKGEDLFGENEKEL